ncbi:MAG: hypothetical protein HFP77_09790 [Methylococcales symbiont of Iophon sp. n. MRB-2018]|nr:MAG: hypothetical protein HFP77_09790 [Methylococcales symbiont of Iophon sp. n. MRB-2018]
MRRIECDDPSFEKRLYRKYKDNNLQGEWFSIEPCDVLDELKAKSTSSFICVHSNVSEFLGCDRDAAPEYLDPWEWRDTEIEEFCPQCDWGGVRHNSALGSENYLRCSHPIF